ncbi:unnamed protein product [Paramecium sonneborni]|uniref:Uncharacterized protein n=1 Tax=Paramecium sonneborni TaxID=65129 RepID=A0A8S1PDK1_9CILI|nr:unnamed protein product [Paramecium sonneborni]
MISVTDYDAIFHEMQVKRQYLDESIKNLQNLNDNKINQALIKLTTEQLNKLKSEKNSQKQKYAEYLKEVNEILENNIKSQQNLYIKDDRLYQIKTSLQPQLLAFIPSVGLRHKRLLQQEQVDVKIRRHKNQNEERLKQIESLTGIGDQEMKQISQNLSKYAKIEETNTPKQDDYIFDNGSLVISKSQSQIKQKQLQQQNPESSIPGAQMNFQQKSLRGQQSSKLKYGDYDDDDDVN